MAHLQFMRRICETEGEPSDLALAPSLSTSKALRDRRAELYAVSLATTLPWLAACIVIFAPPVLAKANTFHQERRPRSLLQGGHQIQRPLDPHWFACCARGPNGSKRCSPSDQSSILRRNCALNFSAANP